MGALTDLVKEGKVREIGCSNFTSELLEQAEQIASTQNTARFVSVQNEFSLLHRDPVQDVLKTCDQFGIAFIPYFPLFGGLLSGKYRKAHALPEGTRIEAGSPRLTEENLDKVERLIAFAESKKHSILDLSFSWLLAHPEVASVIAGATSPSQIKSNAAAAAWDISHEEMQEIARLVR